MTVIKEYKSLVNAEEDSFYLISKGVPALVYSSFTPILDKQNGLARLAVQDEHKNAALGLLRQKARHDALSKLTVWVKYNLSRRKRKIKEAKQKESVDTNHMP